MFILFLIIPPILLVISLILFKKASNLKQELKDKSIEQCDIELQELLSKKKQECDDKIQELENAANERQTQLRQAIEDNEQVINKQEKHKQLLIEKEQEIIDKELDNYRIKKQNKIAEDLNTLWSIKTNEIEKQRLATEKELEQYKFKIHSETNKEQADARLKFEKEKQELEKAYQKRQDEINAEIIELFATKLEIEKDLEDFRNKRAAVNEAILREKEIQEKETFYKIDIPQNDRDDISILREIEPRLRNKEALNKLIYDVFIKRPSQEMIKRVTKGRKISGIYKITYIGTGEAYVGRTSDIANRWKQHIMSSLNIGTIAHTTFHTFLATKGLHQFTFEILEEVDKDRLSEREKYWINFYETHKQLNSNIGG